MKSPASEWIPKGEPLPHRVVLYLPSQTRKHHPVFGFGEIAQRTARELCARFGGVTRYPATGYFRTDSGGIQEEEVQALEFYCSQEEWADSETWIHQLLEVLKRELDQERMACSLDGILLLE